jgi:hypothetical protein
MFFWDITQHRRFGTIGSIFEDVQSDCLIIENGNDSLYGHSSNYHSNLRNPPEERRSHLHSGGKVKVLKVLLVLQY